MEATDVTSFTMAFVLSDGGWSGNKLGPNCESPEALAAVHQEVVDAYGLSAIDIDSENTDEFENEAVQDGPRSATGRRPTVSAASRSARSTGTGRAPAAGVQSNRSGIDQPEWEFTRITAGF